MNARAAFAAAFAVSLVALSAGCGKPRCFDQTLVEVRIVGLWTASDYAASCAAGLRTVTKYPHTVVEDIATGERCRVMGNGIGAVGDVCRVCRCDMHRAGE